MIMLTMPFLIHALSPLHAGVGHADGVVDLPTARMKATGIPFVPGSSIKGVLRDRADERGERRDDNRLLATFGPPTEDASAHAGALVVGDARLLALPVRSFRGTFAWVSSPLLLALARRDLGVAGGGRGAGLAAPSLEGRCARSTKGTVCEHRGKLCLEDLDLPLQPGDEVEKWATFLAPHVYPEEGSPLDLFVKRFVVVDDETMSYFFETALQVDARVRLERSTRTVAKGALWLEESLPPETLLVGLLAADRSRRDGAALTPQAVLDFALPEGGEMLQIGGHATIGRGRCRVVPLRDHQEAGQ